MSVVDRTSRSLRDGWLSIATVDDLFGALDEILSESLVSRENAPNARERPSESCR